MQVSVAMGDSSVVLSVVPQVCELVASGKIREFDTLGDLLDMDEGAASLSGLSVKDLLEHSCNPAYLPYFNMLLKKYRPNIDARQYAVDIFVKLGMRNTCFKGSEIITTRSDLAKFHFALRNGGCYAGKRVFSEYAADLME